MVRRVLAKHHRPEPGSNGLSWLTFLGHTKDSLLERKLLQFEGYYNRERVHQGLGGTIPDPRPASTGQTVADLDNYRWKSCCRGLYQLPAAA